MRYEKGVLSWCQVLRAPDLLAAGCGAPFRFFLEKLSGSSSRPWGGELTAEGNRGFRAFRRF